MDPPNRESPWGIGPAEPGEALPVTTTAPAGAPPGASAETPLSVGSFAATMRARIEATYGARGVWVEGEVRDCSVAKSGHVYFTLRDPHGTDVVRCALWRTARVGPRDRDAIANGAHLVVHGKASVFTGKSEIQILVDAVRLAGRGALLEARERLKAQLEAEGLFAAERKRPLPRDPRVIGLVTSPTGAVVHDVRTVAFQRGGARLLLAPAVVQGPTAPESIVAALTRIAAVEEVDVIIVGRGGGAVEDLACFDDERVVRAIAACPKPVVSAVGHETDFSLADLAADVRAATPSQAAELTVPAAAPRVAALGDAKRRLWRALKERMRLAREELREGREGLEPVVDRLREGERLVDALDAALRERAHAKVRAARREVDALAARLQAVHPAAKLAAQQRRAHDLDLRLRRAGERLLTGPTRALHEATSALPALAQARTAAAREDLARAAASLHALSPLAILSRGYSLVTNARGAAVRRAEDAPPGSVVRVRSAEVRFDARVLDGEEQQP
jgi:exodeoxyribonuclease VII large subunit